MQIALGVIFLFLLIALLSKAEVLTPRNRTVIISILSMIIASAVLYEFMVSKKEEQNRTLINAFKQGKTIICKETPIDQKNFIFETGTMSFMAKESNKTLAGIIYSIKECSYKP
jgi:hypothetical protein